MSNEQPKHLSHSISDLNQQELDNQEKPIESKYPLPHELIDLTQPPTSPTEHLQVKEGGPPVQPGE